MVDGPLLPTYDKFLLLLRLRYDGKDGYCYGKLAIFYAVTGSKGLGKASIFELSCPLYN